MTHEQGFPLSVLVVEDLPDAAGSTARPVEPPAGPAVLAYHIRDHVCVLVNALEVIRLAGGHEPSLARSLQLAGRQLDALARLADVLLDPVALPASGDRRSGE